MVAEAVKKKGRRGSNAEKDDTCVGDEDRRAEQENI